LERAVALGALERRELLRDERLDLALRLVRLLADARALGGGDGPERAQKSCQLAGTAEHADTDLLEVGRGAVLGDLCPDQVEDRLDPWVPQRRSPRRAGLAPSPPAWRRRCDRRRRARRGPCGRGRCRPS